MKTSDTTGSITYMEKQGGTNPGWRFHLVSNRLTLEMRGTGGACDRIRVRGPTSTGTAINDGCWHMLSATYDGSGTAACCGVALYVDGVALCPLCILNDGLVTSSANCANASVGSRTGGGGNFGPGFLDEASIWDVGLTACQISTIYNCGSPINLQSAAGAISASLNAWWRNGDGACDSFPCIIDIQSCILGVMTNMNSGDIVTVVP